MNGRLKFLGTGGSAGIPVIGCKCSVCCSLEPANNRLRASVLISYQSKTFLIDVGPDFRAQALKNKIEHLDGLMITHSHYDHVAGIDDLRPLCYLSQKKLPILLSQSTAEQLQRCYSYLLPPDAKKGGGASFFSLQLLNGVAGTTLFEEVPIRFVTYRQGRMEVNGFKIGSLAYLSDIRDWDPSIIDQLGEVKCLIVSALRYSSSPLHFSVDEAIDFANKLNVQSAWLTHICHDLDHVRTNAYLPDHIKVAYDGLEIIFE